MAFTFYPILDQGLLDRLQDQFNLCSWDIKERLQDYGFEAKQILETVNPVILVMFDLIIDNFMDSEVLKEYLDEDLRDDLRMALQDTYFINAIDSHISALNVLENYQERIMESIQEHIEEEAEYSEDFETVWNKVTKLFEGIDM